MFDFIENFEGTVAKKEIKDISCVLESKTFNLDVADGKKLPYDGYVEIDFTMNRRRKKLMWRKSWSSMLRNQTGCVVA